MTFLVKVIITCCKKTFVFFFSKVIYCGLPESPENGNMNFTGLHFGSEVRYWCSFGYSLVGGDTATCDPDGNWTNPVPLCLETGEKNTCQCFPQSEAVLKITKLYSNQFDPIYRS